METTNNETAAMVTTEEAGLSTPAKVATFGGGLLAGLGLINPITIGVVAVLSFGPHIYDQVSINKREIEKRQTEQYKNTMTFYDKKTDHRYTFKRPATDDEWISIGKRYEREDAGTILRSMGLI